MKCRRSSFPGPMSGTSTLELYGVCRPARIVSGDYYDFLSYGPEQVMVAVGDISGKGISAALADGDDSLCCPGL